MREQCGAVVQVVLLSLPVVWNRSDACLARLLSCISWASWKQRQLPTSSNVAAPQCSPCCVIKWVESSALPPALLLSLRSAFEAATHCSPAVDRWAPPSPQANLLLRVCSPPCACDHRLFFIDAVLLRSQNRAFFGGESVGDRLTAGYERMWFLSTQIILFVLMMPWTVYLSWAKLSWDINPFCLRLLTCP